MKNVIEDNYRSNPCCQSCLSSKEPEISASDLRKCFNFITDTFNLSEAPTFDTIGDWVKKIKREKKFCHKV